MSGWWTGGEDAGMMMMNKKMNARMDQKKKRGYRYQQQGDTLWDTAGSSILTPPRGQVPKTRPSVRLRFFDLFDKKGGPGGRVRIGRTV